MNKLHPGNTIDAGISADRLGKLENLCSEWVSEDATPALSVLAARHGIIFLNKSWGKLIPDSNSHPVSDNSLFSLASCSKPVTATAVMMLVEEGRIGLHHPLQQYLPEFDGPDCETITIRHLLTHTSGLPCSSNTEPINAAKDGLDYQPGSKMVYSSVGYNLLGELVERISGQTYDLFTKQRIFEPLGMHNTTFIHMGLDRERCVHPRPGTTYDWPEESEGIISASSTLWSTAYDMGIFLQTFLNHGRYGPYQLVSQPTVAAMTRDQVPGIPRELINGITNQAQGLGWFMLYGIRFPNSPCLISKTSYGHSGSSGAFIWVDPAYDLIGVFLFVKITDEFRPLDLFVDSIMGSIIDD